jgi:hypothetical protein
VERFGFDNATAALSLHDSHFVLHAQDHAENIRVERCGIAFRGLVRDRANLAFGASIVRLWTSVCLALVPPMKIGLRLASRKVSVASCRAPSRLTCCPPNRGKVNHTASVGCAEFHPT